MFQIVIVVFVTLFDRPAWIAGFFSFLFAFGERAALTVQVAELVIDEPFVASVANLTNELVTDSPACAAVDADRLSGDGAGHV